MCSPQRTNLLTLIMLGFLENDKNGEIQYLCMGMNIGTSVDQ